MIEITGVLVAHINKGEIKNEIRKTACKIYCIM